MLLVVALADADFRADGSIEASGLDYDNPRGRGRCCAVPTGGLPPDILGERHRNNFMYIESGTVELGAPVIPPFAAEIQSV